MENTIGGASTSTTTPLPSYSGSVNPTLDLLPIYQAANTGVYSISRNAYLGLSSAPLGTTDTQSPTNKTFNNTNSLTVTTSNLTIQDPTDNTKQANFLISGNTTGTDRIYTLPNYNATLASLAGSETLTNKTLTSPTINAPTITQASITADALSGYTSADTGTIYGISVTSSTIGSAAIAAGAIIPSALDSVAGSSWTWQSWTPTWTNITIGNATVNGTYIQTGKTVTFCLDVTFGSTTSISGSVKFSLPVTSVAAISNSFGHSIGIGTCAISTSGTAYTLLPFTGSTTTCFIYGGSSSAGEYNALSSTVPFTWTTGSVLTVTGVYQAAS